MIDTKVVVKRVEKRSDEIVSIAQQLVRTNTVNPYSGDPPERCGGEAAGQAVIEPLLAGIGARIEKFDCPPDIYAASGVLGPKNRDFRGRPNLVAEITFGPGCQRALLMFHMDTVGVTGMTIPPHSGEIRDDKLYGRGASDTRGGIAVAIMAALVLHEFRDQLRGSLTIFSAVDEECNGGGAGAMACLQRLKRRPAPVTGSSPLFTFAVCTDGSGPTVTRGFGGVITGELCVHGQGGHAAAPGGVNAIDKAVIVKGALDAFKQERETAGAGPVNLGIFRAGVHPAVIPAEASAGGTSEGLALVELPRVPRCPSASRLGELREGLVGMEGRGGWGRCGVRLPPVCGIGLEGTVRQSVRSGGARLDFGDCAVCPAHPPFGRGSAVG